MFPEKQELKKRITDVIDRTQKAPDEYYYSPGTTKYERLNSFIKDADQLYRFSDYGIQASKDGIAFTLKANMGTWHDRVPIVKDNFGIRRITPEECLALQSFPDSFSFPNDIPPASKYKQAGNTVCVSLIQAIASKIRQLNKQVSEKSTFGL